MNLVKVNSEKVKQKKWNSEGEKQKNRGSGNAKWIIEVKNRKIESKGEKWEK